MPDVGPHVECNTCGKTAPWQSVTNGVKRLPPDWHKLEGTTSGTVYFCSALEEQVWKDTRHWQYPKEFITTVVSDSDVADLSLPCPIEGCPHVSVSWKMHNGHMGAAHSGRKSRRTVEEITNAG